MRERGRVRGRLRTWRPPTPTRSDLKRARVRASGWQEIATSTPGRLAGLGLILILLALGSGVLAGSGTDSREARISTLRLHAEPLASAAQDLYSSLSVADAAASTAFLAGGLQPLGLQDRYNEALGTASAALSTAAIGVDQGDAEAKRLLAQIGSQLPIYTGLIATANTNNRAGNPVGVSYLNEASYLLQGTMLPRAQRLYSDQAATVAELDTRNSALDWAPLGLIALTLVLLVYFQIHVARQSRRVFNFGLLPATLALGLLFAWALTAGIVSSSHSERALVESSRPLGALTNARILAQQVRTEETMDLLQRASGPAQAATFANRLGEVGALIDDGSRADSELSTAALAGWRDAHQTMEDRLAAGDYPGAVATTISSDPDSARSYFVDLDRELSSQIDQLRSDGQSAASSAQRALTFLALGSGVLSIAAAVLIGLGLWPRLSEYQ